MKIINTLKKIGGLGFKLYKLYDNLPEEDKEKVNKIVVKAASKAIENM